MLIFCEDRRITLLLLPTKFGRCHHHLLQHVRHAVHLVLLDRFVHHIMTYFGPQDFLGLSALTANHDRCHQPIKVNDDPSLRHNILDMSNPDNVLKSTQILKIPTAKHIYTSRQVFQKLIQYIFASSYQQHLHTAHPTTK